MAYNFTPLKQKTKDTEEWLKKEFGSLRTGRVTPTLLDVVKVEVYGSFMPVSQVASITTEDARSLRVSPWDTTQIKPIEKAIQIASLGASIVVDDKGLRVIFPDLTSERREILLKTCKQKLEDARVALRIEREKVWTDIQKQEKEGKINEDERFRLKNEMQKIVDEANKKLEENFEKKEKEINS